MSRKILIEVDLGRKGAEKCDIEIYVDGKLIECYFDKSYSDLPGIAEELKAGYQDTEIETLCLGEDCCGGTYRWNIDI
ncbi:MAG: hypothetical protein WC560_03110 [Syntrophales bacterium]